MNPPLVVWISGWASDISLWRTTIQERFSAYTHAFIDYGDLLPDPEQALRQHTELAPARHVIAWSLGTLALWRAWGTPPSTTHWTLVTPFAHFCAPSLGWPQRTVQRMARQILQNPQATLESFAQLMGPAPAQTQQQWLHNALRYTPQQLALGLEYLAQQNAFPPSSDAVQCLWGSKDQVVPSAHQQQLRSFPHHIVSGAGHWICDYWDYLGL